MKIITIIIKLNNKTMELFISISLLLLSLILIGVDIYIIRKELK
jgi:hypothetical protein